MKSKSHPGSSNGSFVGRGQSVRRAEALGDYAFSALLTVLTALPRSFRLFLIEPHMLGAEREDALAVVGIARLDPRVGRRLLALGVAFVPVRVAGAAALAAGDEAGHRLHSLLRHACDSVQAGLGLYII